MAARQGPSSIPIPIRQADLADHFADAIPQAETLCFNAHGVAKYLLSRAVRDAGYKVVLTGEGSDEILGGYAHFRRDMLLYNREGQDPADVAGAARGAGPRPTRFPAGCCCRTGKPGSLDTVRRLLGFVPVLDRDFLGARGEDAGRCWPKLFSDRFGGREGFRALLSDIDVRGQLAGREPLNQSLYLWAKTACPATS